MSRNTDPLAPWNDPIHKDDPFAPHNDPMRTLDPVDRLSWLHKRDFTKRLRAILDRTEGEGENWDAIREHARMDKLAAAMIAERDGGEDSYISPDLKLECSRCGHTRWLVLGREP